MKPQRQFSDYLPFHTQMKRSRTKDSSVSFSSSASHLQDNHSSFLKRYFLVFLGFSLLILIWNFWPRTRKPYHRIECNAVKQCTVYFFDENHDVSHLARLSPETHSLFPSHFQINQEKIAPTRHYQVYHSIDSSGYGSALIYHNELLQGIFVSASTAHILEYNVLATKHHEEEQVTSRVHRVVEVPGLGRPWLLPSHHFELGPLNRHTNIADDLTAFFPGCYRHDSISHVFPLHVVYDFSLVERITRRKANKLAAVLEDIDMLFAVSKIAFLKQLNIRLEVSQVSFSKASDSQPCSSYNASHWEGGIDSSNIGLTFVFTDCGAVSTSFLGSACQNRHDANVRFVPHSWLSVFHELGHAFGVDHSVNTFHNDAAGRDSNDMFLNNVQIAGSKRRSICNFLAYLESTCSVFTI